MSDRQNFLYRLFYIAGISAMASAMLTATWMTLMFDNVPFFLGVPGILLYTRVVALAPAKWNITFYFTFANTLVMLPIVLGFFYLIRKPAPVRAILSLAYGLMYLPMTSISHFFQVTVVPRSAEEMMAPVAERAKAAHFAQAGGWIYINTDGPGYALDMLASTFFGIALLLVGSAIIREKGVKRLAGALMSIAGLAQIFSILGYIFRNEFFEITGTSASEIFLALLYPFIVVLFFREAKAARAAK